jgi:hypothetical protein
LFARFQRKIDGLVSTTCCGPKAITEPVYSELTTTYMFFTAKDQATAILGDHISKLVKVAVFPAWFPYLVQQGRQEQLVQRCTCYGGVQVWAITLVTG